MLESHYFFEPDCDTNDNYLPGKVDGWGPFVAIQPGSSEIIEAIALGVMLGYKIDDNNKTSNSWNIGIGAIVDPNVRILGDGLTKNQPLPEGETKIRYKTTSQWGVLIITSFSF